MCLQWESYCPVKYKVGLVKCLVDRARRICSKSNARFTVADPMPRLCPDAVGSANVNGLPTRNRPSGPHQEAIGRSSGNIKHV